MAQTITLSAGQISDLVEVGPGTRITVTGSAYVEYAQGNLQDAKNGVLAWQKWPKGAVNGVCDTIRRMTIRATATGSASVLIEEGFRDADTDSGYWQEQTAQLATDAAGNASGYFINGRYHHRQRKQLSNLMSKSFCGRYANVASGADHTTHVQTPVAGHFDAVRLLIPNGVASTITGVKASVAVTNAAGANNSSGTINPTGAWKDLLVSGASSWSLPAGTNADDCSWTATDWFYVNSLDRADSGTLPILNYRIEVPAANANITLTNYSVTDWETEGGFNGGMFYRPRTQAVLGCTTKGNFTSTTTAGQHYPVIIQYLSRVAGVSVYVCADSIGEGADATYRNSGYPFFAGLAASTTTRPVEICNQGITSKTAAVYLARMKKVMAAGGAADIVLYHSFSPNNISSTIDAGEINTLKSTLVDAIQYINSVSAIPVVVSAAPANYAAAAWGATDSLRTDFNAEIASRGLSFFDLSALLSGSVEAHGQTEYLPAYYFDGIHPNLAGRQAAGAALSIAVLQSIF